MSRPRILPVLLLLALCGCSGARSGSSPSSAVDGCSAVLPLARDEVATSSRLVSVHALRRGDTARYLKQAGVPASPSPAAGLPSAGASPSPAAERPPRGCVVVFEGPFTDVEFTPPAVQPSGRWALVFLDVRHPRVRRLVLTNTLPRGLAE